MYLEHFNLSKKPFQQLPDPSFLFLTDQHDEALTRMQFALEINDSLVVITGEIGSGKTTLVRKVLAELPTEFTEAFITHTRVSDVELLQSILLEFGIRPFDMGKIEMLSEIKKFIESQQAEGKRAIVIVDEAQNLGLETLEELRLLTCLDNEHEKAINIVLIGQPQLSTLIDSPELEQLRQRCRLRFHLHRLSQSQTREYIEHRVNVAAERDAGIFDDISKALVYEHTRGIPRLINTLCDTALMMACVSGSTSIGKNEIDEALSELGWPSASTGPYPTLNEEDVQSRWTAVLSMIEGSSVAANFPLTESSYIIGRAEDCGIRIDSKYFSRHHALISLVADEWSITDLRSTNGVAVNGKALKTSALQNGDVIAIGMHQFVFRLAEQQIGEGESAMSAKRSESSLAQTFVIVDDKVVDGPED